MLIGIFFHVPVSGQTIASEGKAGEKAVFLDMMLQCCIEQAVGKGRHPDQARARCGCINAVFDANLSSDDLVEMGRLANEGTPYERVPRFMDLLPQLEECDRAEQ
jgi:hypothetical protein